MPRRTASYTLDGVKLFEGLDPAHRAVIAQRCHWYKAVAGEQLVSHLDPSRQVYFVVAGRARVLVHSRGGRQVSYRDIEAGEMFGEFAAIDGQSRSATVLAVTECAVAVLDDSAFREIVLDHREVTLRLLRHLTGLVRYYSERVRELAILPVDIRVRLELLRLAHEQEGQSAIVEPAPTHAELAERIGTHREAVTRALATLRRGGLLTTTRRCYSIPDLGALRASIATADID